MRRLAALLLLAGCAAAAPQPSARGLAVAPYGLQPGGTPLRIDFGRAEEGVIGPVSRLLGAAPASQRADAACGARITRADWAGGLTLIFRDGDFAGWSAPADFPATGGAPAPDGGRRTAGLACA